METFIQDYVGQNIRIVTVNETLEGKLASYANGWLALEDKKGKLTHINADYVIRVNPK